ncbi:sedoheptulokinase-like [Oppia nitens]|uniref:sedoheptulokinase-like n=1 Tax=Oppia nitens TaxID=1686743 RepID=UPI0023DBF716|nr:sedoheptulokinase-like [Oppia nitens]
MPLIAGLDIGSTSVKISLLDTISHQIVATNSKKYEFKVNEEIRVKHPEYCQQNVSEIIGCIHETLATFDDQQRSTITMISICGQMHGCVLWNNDSYLNYYSKRGQFDIDDSRVSDLYNWQDMRCTDKFIASLPKPHSYADRISTGFGCATIFWLTIYEKQFVQKFNSSATIMDFIVTIICGLKHPVMSTQNAMSWGYFDPIGHKFNENLLKNNGFPVHLLPTVSKCGSIAGKTVFNWLGIPVGTPVLVAMGDMQCATYVNLRHNPNSAVINISTSMQLSVLNNKNFTPESKSVSKYKSIDYFPYFDDTYLSVAASLNGGNVLQHIINFIKDLIEDITGIKVPDNQIWHKIFQLHQNQETDISDNNLLVKPTLFGERHDPSLKASIVNISKNVKINKIIEAFCNGIIDNVFEMMPIEYIKENNITQVIGTGTVLIKNPIMRGMLETKLEIPIVYIENSDADVGAVWVAFDYIFNTQ